MRVYTCTNFRGKNPVGVAAVVVATDITDAERVLRQILFDKGLPQKEGWVPLLRLVDTWAAGHYALILNDGDY